MRGYTPQQQAIVRQKDERDKLIKEENEKRKKAEQDNLNLKTKKDS